MATESVSSSTTRITGLVSGLDTESIVESLLSIDQSRIDSQEQEIQLLEWEAETLREVNSAIKEFTETYMSTLSTDTNMYSSLVYDSFEVTMLDETSAVTVSANSTASEGTLTINSITQLAEAAEASSTMIFNTTDDISLDTALSELDLSTALEFVDGEISFSINGETFTFTEDTTLNDMITEINSSDAGVTVDFSSLKKGLTITADETGADSTVEIVNITGNAFDATSSAFGISEDTYTGQNAIVEIEGITVEKSSNTFTIDGITYSLRTTTDTETSFTVERDVQSTVDRVVAFIDAYNELVTYLQDIIDEEKNYDYDPLTDAERDELTDDQIEDWEEQAKLGILADDSAIESLLSGLRTAFYTAVEDAGIAAYDIGLTTGTYSDGAVIEVDEDALAEAIAANPTAVSTMFFNLTDDYSESGLINKIDTLLDDYVSNATYNTIADKDEQIADAEDELDDLEDTYDNNEERYWDKYTALETALAEMNSQIESLLSALGYSTS